MMASAASPALPLAGPRWLVHLVVLTALQAICRGHCGEAKDVAVNNTRLVSDEATRQTTRPENISPRMAWSLDQDWLFFQGDSPALCERDEYKLIESSRRLVELNSPLKSDSETSARRNSEVCTLAFCQPSFDDSAWRVVETPHDWSIEDLPARSSEILTIRNGTWLFSPGDVASWADPLYDDSRWQRVQVPSDWRVASNYTASPAWGWYRRRFNATVDQLASRSLMLALGAVAKQDTTFINGKMIGHSGGDASGTGAGCYDYLQFRSYAVPPGLLKRVDNVVAVRVFSEGGGMPGGLYDHSPTANGDRRQGAFDAAASAGGRATGYVVGGVGWYRKRFATPEGAAEGVLTLEFGGVYMRSSLYLNGRLLNEQPYGYSPFHVVLPRLLLAAVGESNTLAVRVDNSGRNSRWYSGSGIFRHVRFLLTQSVHVARWGVGLSTLAIGSEATVAIDVTVTNDSPAAAAVDVRADVFSPSGDFVANASLFALFLPPGGPSLHRRMICKLKNPLLWAPESPELYSVKISVLQQPRGVLIDEIEELFGVRTVHLSAEQGFLLNGKSVKLRGGCVHHDNGPLGSVAITRAEIRRVEILKANGYNAVRTSHNPVSAEFLQACDRIGMLVMDEAFDCWEGGKNADDYHKDFDAWWRRDLSAMVLRDRNHPSVVIWSIGNEIPIRSTARGYNLSRELSDLVRSLDLQGRPVSAAYPGVDSAADGFFAPLDLAGYNYSPERYVPDHARVPARVMVATESFPHLSYDYWRGVWDHPWVVGDFIWTAIDYLGESAIGNAAYSGPGHELDACFTYQASWSWHTSSCGDVDICGFKKPQSHYRNVLWGLSQIEMLVHEPPPPNLTERVSSWGWPNEEASWTWPGVQGRRLEVNVYTWHRHVTLLLDGEVVGVAGADGADADGARIDGPSAHGARGAMSSLKEAAQGSKQLGPVTGHQHGLVASQQTMTSAPLPSFPRLTASFSVAYRAGNLTAVGTSDGVSHSIGLFTAGAPVSLGLSLDRHIACAHRDELVYATVEVRDGRGRRVPRAQLRLEFNVSGDGELYRVGSGDPRDLSSFTRAERITHRGRALAVLRPFAATTAGRIVLTVRGQGVGQAIAQVKLVAPSMDADSIESPCSFLQNLPEFGS